MAHFTQPRIRDETRSCRILGRVARKVRAVSTGAAFQCLNPRPCVDREAQNSGYGGEWVYEAITRAVGVGTAQTFTSPRAGVTIQKVPKNECCDKRDRMVGARVNYENWNSSG